MEQELRRIQKEEASDRGKEGKNERLNDSQKEV